MDLNVCSRRVHDGYATIRSRGRARPRALYRSDSEELLKEGGGPYALPRLSNFPVDPHQPARWSDFANDCHLIENYATLRGGCGTIASRKVAVEQQRRVVTLNTFSSKAKGCQRRDDRITFDSFRSSNDSSVITASSTIDPNESTGIEAAEGRGETRLKKGNKQPIYAVPNILSKSSRRDRRIAVVDGNYVASGDLYRTTAKYIEDINKNIAEIDKSYEELKKSSNPDDPGYGSINKIAIKELDRSCNLYGYARKRDMAPMPPISCDFGESLDERGERQEEEEEEVVDPSDKRNESDNCFVFKSRPNSLGKLPPKLLPRSSSIENASRHSTGSTATTASSSSTTTKSSESLYAISEAWTSVDARRNVERNLSPRSANAEDEIESKDESVSSTDDDRPIVRSVDRLPPVTGPIRKNRSRVDRADGTCSRRETVERNFQESRGGGKVWEGNGCPGRRYDTLPSRRSRASSRPLHKSSEDVLDGERVRSSSSLRRPCASDVDVSHRNRDDDRRNYENSCPSSLPFYLMDATDVIMHGRMDRGRKFRRQHSDHFSRLFHGRTRHNSLESEEAEDRDDDDNEDGNNCRRGGFATLPRRGGNLSKEQPSNDPLRRLSGNVPILEPLYEHAVSDPVKPRSTENVIPWWELATRKYRHRSCPSLQVNKAEKKENQSVFEFLSYITYTFRFLEKCENLYSFLRSFFATGDFSAAPPKTVAFNASLQPELL